MSDWTGMFDEALEVSALDAAPPGADEPKDALAAVAAKRGVLAMLGPRDEPIVLIAAADMRSRLRNRLSAPADDRRTKSADLRPVTRKVLWKRTYSHFETDLAYLSLAAAIWPGAFASMVAWKPAWFVHVDPEADLPRFVRTRDVRSGPGLYVGPFMNASGAERFIDVLRDVFSLCRDGRRLRLAPNASTCSYGQMGRCPSPCDGSISMQAYRRMVAEAADFAAGSRDRLRRSLDGQMREAARALQFERAAGLKRRIDRLAELDGVALAQAAPLEEFRFVAVQSGPSRRKASAFLVNAGDIAGPVELSYPLCVKELESLTARMASRAAGAVRLGPTGLLRMGLVARYLFSGRKRKGLMLRWREGMSADVLADAIESAVDTLNLRAPKPRRPKACGARKDKKRQDDT